MADEIRRHYQIRYYTQGGQPSITNYFYNSTNFEFPIWLKFQIPLELHNAQACLQEHAFKAIRSMKELMYFRDNRFSFLCPQKPRTDWGIHCKSVVRLVEWQQDTYPTNSILRRDATLAPRPKLPKDLICLHLDPTSYDRFVSSYAKFVGAYLRGAWTDYATYKRRTENVATQVLDQFTYNNWREWWDSAFCVEMCKWEDCVASLPMPLWEDVIEELYLMILDRVDEPDELTYKLFQIGNARCKGCIGKIGANMWNENNIVEYQSAQITVYLDANTIDLDMVEEEEEEEEEEENANMYPEMNGIALTDR